MTGGIGSSPRRVEDQARIGLGQRGHRRRAVPGQHLVEDRPEEAGARAAVGQHQHGQAQLGQHPQPGVLADRAAVGRQDGAPLPAVDDQAEWLDNGRTRC